MLSGGFSINTKFKIFLEILPKTKEYKLKDQMIRCLCSVTNNIAEGYGRFHCQGDIQFCRISRGSLFEVIDHLLISVEKSYMDKIEF